MWQSKREISRECNDIIGSAKGSQISEKYWGEVGKGKRADIYLEVRKRRGHIFFEWNKCLWFVNINLEQNIAFHVCNTWHKLNQSGQWTNNRLIQVCLKTVVKYGIKLQDIIFFQYDDKNKNKAKHNSFFQH